MVIYWPEAVSSSGSHIRQLIDDGVSSNQPEVPQSRVLFVWRFALSSFVL